MSPVPFTPDVERIQPDEMETIAELSALFREVQERVLRNDGEARRGTHAKATGFLKGELVIAAGLAPELRQGLFSQEARYKAVVRLSQGPSEDLSDKASGQRGFSIKLLGVEGPHVAGGREQTTQDWVLGTHDAAFTDPTIQAFLRTFRPSGGQSTRVPEAVIVAASRAARGAEAALEAVGGGSGHLRFFGKPPTHPLSDSYFSQAPSRFGRYIAQLCVVPTAATLANIGDPKADTNDDQIFRHLVEGYFKVHEAVFDVKVQLCTDLKTMPVEDASVVWPVEESQFRTIGQLIFPIQAAWTEARRAYFEACLSFNPVHSLEEHRPLGSIMRGRMAIYPQTQDFRQLILGASPAEPQSLMEVPD